MFSFAGDLLPIAPVLIVSLFAIVALAPCFARKRQDERLPLTITVAGLALALVVTLILFLQQTSAEPFHGTIAINRNTLLLQGLLLVAGLFTALLSGGFVTRSGLQAPEYFALLATSLTGMMLFVAARDLIVLFVALELLSIPLYILAAFARHRIASVEAGFKYFLIGSFASAFFLFGTALLYGSTGSTMYQHFALRPATRVLFEMGLAFLFVGLAFKIAAVPFHMWAPDVYEGAPTPITAFMATAVKVAGFGALVALVQELAKIGAAAHVHALSTIAVLTMIVGNLGALLQPNIKRLLAYSSIAHAGYLLVGMTALAARPDGRGATAVVFYLVAYTFMTLGAFAVVLCLNARDQEFTNVEDFRGLARRRPALAFTMAIFMFALAGVPPTAGFFGKFFLFQAAVEAHFLVLAITLAAASALSAYYYLRVVAVMYMKPADEKAPAPILDDGVLGALALGSVAVTLLLGTLPSGLMTLLTRVLP